MRKCTLGEEWNDEWIDDYDGGVASFNLGYQLNLVVMWLILDLMGARLVGVAPYQSFAVVKTKFFAPGKKISLA